MEWFKYSVHFSVLLIAFQARLFCLIEWSMPSIDYLIRENCFPVTLPDVRFFHLFLGLLPRIDSGRQKDSVIYSLLSSTPSVEATLTLEGLELWVLRTRVAIPVVFHLLADTSQAFFEKPDQLPANLRGTATKASHVIVEASVFDLHEPSVTLDCVYYRLLFCTIQGF